MSLRFTHPLIWPSSSPRTAKWSQSHNTTFKSDMPMQDAVMFLEDEVKAFNTQQATLCTDYENMDNPRMLRKVGQDNGAVLKLKINNVTYELACDKWLQIEHNIYALHLALRNMRAIMEWGVGSFENLFGGFVPGAARSAGMPGYPEVDRRKDGSEAWRLTLGLGPTATLEDAHAVYRRRAKSFADNPEALMYLNLAMDEANKALS